MSSKENLSPSSSTNKNLFLNFNCKFLFLCINLIFNGLIARRINFNLIGIANIRLELLYSTILFLSRESLRRYVPKLTDIHSISHYINLIWLILPFGFLFIFVSLFLTLFISINYTDESFPYYGQACFLYALSAFIQLLSEPLYLLAKLTGNDRINIFFELIASILGRNINGFPLMNSSFIRICISNALDYSKSSISIVLLWFGLYHLFDIN